MFKLESYITPILLSYVDKYIKNFRPEDSQVSLWGGDASFHNLDLRLEVLEQELQLPFSFVSGHIHELLIHVPWTKLASEPISITINTIECILKLRSEESVASDTASNATGSTSKDNRKKSRGNKQDIVAPPGYVQTLVNKIVSNITILCNNLILKYVEEDIVLSVNVKTVALQSADENWEPAFTDISPVQVMLRKLITLSDLTICLDKRNASGKIEMYQEPLLYRCVMEIHLLRSYHSAKSKRASVTRLDLHCSRMDFSLTEQQVPMLMRLMLLAIALQQKELRPDPVPGNEQDVNNLPDTEQIQEEEEEDDYDDETQGESWAGWAWSWVPAILPLQAEEEWGNEQQQLAYNGHTFHFGFYVQQASISLKVTESTSERSYYGPRKVKFVPFLVLQLHGCFVDTVIHGVGWLNAQVGISYANLQPYGDCFCGLKEGNAKQDYHELWYFSAGSEQNNYVSESLFDPTSTENKGQKKSYNVSWDYHLATVTESLLLERSPALAVDYLYMLEIPDDFTSERLSELGSDLEYSNLSEKALCRVVIGSTVVHLCSGLFHRLQMVQYAARSYDYGPYSTPKPEPSREQLPPASAEDFEALDASIPLQVFQVTLFKPEIHIHMADHPTFDPSIFHGHRKRRRSSRVVPLYRAGSLPKLTISCQCLDAKLVKPMYPRRLVTTTCQLPAPPQHMFHACHIHLNVKLLGVDSHLVLDSNKQTTVVMPSNISFSQETLLLPHYWSSPDLPHSDVTLQAESITVTCTKAKLMIISYIIQSMFDPHSCVEAVNGTTLLADSAKDKGVEFLEFYIEELNFHQVSTPDTTASAVTLGALKAFVLEELTTGTHQALVLSGPDTPSDVHDNEAEKQLPLITCTLQSPKDPKNQSHPPVLIFNLRMVQMCMDPLLWRWLHYSPLPVPKHSQDYWSVESTATNSTAPSKRSRKLSETSGAFPESSRRASTPQESVHSSSDRDQMPAQVTPSLSHIAPGRENHSKCVKEETPPPPLPSPTEPVSQTGSREYLLRWFPVWRGLVLNGDMAQCVIYIPTDSLSAVGAQTIEEAVNQCLCSDDSPDVLVIKFPFVSLRSSPQRQCLLQYTSHLPVKLPDNIWTRSKVSFPWGLTLSDLSVYTIQNGRQLNFLKPVSATATVGISTKYQADQTTLSSLGFCVHIDTTPICLSMSESQVRLIGGVLLGLMEVASAFHLHTLPKSDSSIVVEPSTPTPTSPTLFRESLGSRESPLTPRGVDEYDEQGQMQAVAESVKITVWMQSTLARLTVALYTDDFDSESPHSELKLTFDMEDIMTSFDLQPVYLKVKCKIASAAVQHFVRLKNRQRWHPGPYLGLVMRGLEDITTSPSHSLQRDIDDSCGSFLSITFTRARCCHVHSRWGTRKQTTLLAHTRSTDSVLKGNTMSSKNASRFISEIVIKLQAVDFVFSPATLASFFRVLRPLLILSNRQHRYESAPADDVGMSINNTTLPLLYLDSKAVRLIMPASELVDIAELHDVCMLQLDEITLSPQVENPLGRVLVRPDIYHMAEQARILGVPGSEVEDRQYQLDVVGLCVNTATWCELDHCLSMQGASANLRTMNENPALEWNSLVKGRESITPHVSLLPVVSRIDLCVVFAPAIVYHDDILVSGHSLEVNAITNIEVSVSTSQLLLASALLAELMLLAEPLAGDIQFSQVTIPPSMLSHRNSEDRLMTLTEYNKGGDSGVDCADVSSVSTRNVRDDSLTQFRSAIVPHVSLRESSDTAKSSGFHEDISHQKSVTYKEIMVRNVRPKAVHQITAGKVKETQPKNLVPIEILLTSGTVSVVLYELCEDVQRINLLWRKKRSSSVSVPNDTTTGKKSTEETPPHKKHVQPLMFMLIAQPHAFISRHSLSRKIQISCFDVNVRASVLGKTVVKAIPTLEDFSEVLLETKCGEPHPVTGIPPSFLTIKWSRALNKAAKLEVDLGRPTKLYFSLARWQYLEAVKEKVLRCIIEEVGRPSKPSKVQSVYRPVKSTLEEEESGKVLAILVSKETFPVDLREEEEEEVSAEVLGTLTNGTSMMVGSVDGDGGEEEVGAEGTEETSIEFDSVAEVSSIGERQLQNRMGGLAAVAVSTQQLVFTLETASGMEVTMSVAGLSGSVATITRSQADRIIGNISVNSLILTTKTENITRLLLNPWSFTADICFAWEVWHTHPPQVQLTAESDCVILDLGPEHLRCLHCVWSEFAPLLQSKSSQSKPSPVWESPQTEYEQHYRDDLRAGAFQFMEATCSREDTPLPYQVVFWASPPTMAWRYPQPRVLTRVDVFPVPFKVASARRDGSTEHQDRVLCSLQYWSECQARYQSYAQFYLSESEPCHLELPSEPRRAVACTWRVRLALESEEEEEDSRSRVSVSPQALAACMRVDSFFSPSFVPTLQVAINITSLQLSLHNHISPNMAARPMPPPLQNFTPDNLIPETQCFMSTAMDNCSLFLCSWPSGSSIMEFSSRIRCDIIDYAYLTQHCVVEPFQMQLNFSTGNTFEVSCITKPISIRLGPAIGHTLAVSAQLWTQTWQTFSEDALLETQEQYQIVISRYIVCNDTTTSLRFGQMSTDEDILLLSRHCHLYSWRTQKIKQQLRIAIANGAWTWSEPFCIDTDGLQLCSLVDAKKHRINVVIDVTSLSATQKQVVISGQLVITNLLTEAFECKVLSSAEDDNKVLQAQNLVAVGHDTPPSVILTSTSKTALRIRFHGLDSLWSGDIPLSENPKSAQPWLVKIPLQEKGQFLSIWCRVIHQIIGQNQKILAMLCPLYMIRSHLPVAAKVVVDTPGLKVNMLATITGKGQQQQLYCPGTIDHSHKLMVQLENGIPPSNPYVPLSYSMIDQRTFFKLNSLGELDISHILKSLVTVPDKIWPFVGDEYRNTEWVEAEQPQTYVQVKYKPLGPYCSTLLVELQPWALFVNTLGCSVAVVVQEVTIFTVPHRGVVTPPKLEGTFHLALEIKGRKCCSPSLQLARPDWGNSFYMPRIAGLIPVTGQIQTMIMSSNLVSFANISSNLEEDMRIVHIRPSFILCNHTDIELIVSTIAIRDSEERRVLSHEMEICSSLIPPDLSAGSNVGIPLIEWLLLGEGDKDIVHYLVFSTQQHNRVCSGSGSDWSCPVRVSNGLSRHCFTIPNRLSEHGHAVNEAFVLTAQERCGQVYLSLYREPYPQVTIHNKCNFKLLCAQGTPENDGLAIQEAEHIEWWCAVEPYTSVHYFLPGSLRQFPDVVGSGTTPPIVLAMANPPSYEEHQIWSLCVNISEVQEQFVCLPGHGDVKVHVELLCHTIHVTIETVSHIEISARDIRSRLLERDMETTVVHFETLNGQDGPLMEKNNVKCSIPSTSSKLKAKDSYSSLKSFDKSVCETATETTISSYNSALDVLPETLHASRASSSRRSNLSVTSGSSKAVLKDSEIEDSLQDFNSSTAFQGVFFIKGLHLILLDDLPKSGSERTEVIMLTLDNVCASLDPHLQANGNEGLRVSLLIGDLQIDNQMYQRGGFDFPVVLLGQIPRHQNGGLFSLSVPAKKLMEQIESNALVTVCATLEKHSTNFIAKLVQLSVGSLSAYVEDTLITRLMENCTCFLPNMLMYLPVLVVDAGYVSSEVNSFLVPVPQAVFWDSRQLASPIRLYSLSVKPLSVLVSVHTSVKLYVALDHSPLQFAAFERHQLVTTPYRLGHTIAMHYLSGAIFGMGWVVGSLEILGSPGGFARTLGTGLRDFVYMPYQGILQGPWAFLVGVSHGSASLMKHITAGTLSSVTKLAASIARNLDRLTLDREHLQRTEELRRQHPQGLAQGLLQGLTGLGISLLGAVGGIAHHPLQSMMSDGASPRGLVTGVGLGLVGVITKPLSGAAELVALTGEGLLHGTGWTIQPKARHQPVIEHAFCGINSRLKYSWKLVPGLAAGKHTLLHVTEATYITSSGGYQAVALVLTTRALFLVSTEEDVTHRVLALSELTGVDNPSDPTLLSFQFHTPGPLREMDAASHARVVDFVRRSSGLVTTSNTEEQVDLDPSVPCGRVETEIPNIETSLTFYVNPQSRNYFLTVLALAKQQSQGKGFSIL
ncbi:intermembrane lipid transfer protein VPS13B [Anabrus simplex]|uniref:intermembrane lipid transfer protein VPS13B n=1 Tax=Anabrus simplex TaxID=316456 RepID=UPI0035A37290